MPSTVRLRGFRELEAALNDLPKATRKNVLRRVAKGALLPMADKAALLAPRDEGDLSFSIEISEERTPSVRKARRFDTKTGIEMAMGPTTGKGVLFYAAFQEFGTVKMAANPFMRPAWDARAGGALDYIKSNLWIEIRKSAERRARNLARG